MFNSISWQEFLTTLAVAVGSYYAITTLFFYSREITTLFKHKEPEQLTSETNDDQYETTESTDLMGKIKYETEVNVPREKIVTTEEIRVLSPDESEEVITTSPSNHADTVLIGTIADLLQEVKALAVVVSDCSKEDAVLLFKSLLSGYPQLAGTHFQEAVSLYIFNSCKENCAFSIASNEINSWWSSEESISANNQ